MLTSLPTHRLHRVSSAVAIAGAVLAITAGCTQPAAAPVESHTFGMHQVIATGTAGMLVAGFESGNALDTFGYERIETALAAMAWFL